MTEDRTNIQTFVVSVFYHYWAQNSVGIYSLLKDPCSNILSVVGVEEKCLLPSAICALYNPVEQNGPDEQTPY